ncbi:GbsR/MarR family transcriptional regulator [Salisediminibacterium beveridgei]|uniref:HTH-type transcriptional regulator n=1 Tax=Salisediminibacterium beveridgei TaxID=632773 RepID=A0A1D7QZ78_9BACI|nr:transcriptional regulator [Salisediminibacterium beveridgei]AOM84308.1 Putative HTH-type transcriptional regulator yvbF [Salisediminibacterium beveridgei]
MKSEDRLRSDQDRLEAARDRFISEIAKNIHLYDLSPSTGRLYGTVFFSEEPMTLDEMSEQMGMSKTSMSTGIRSLVEASMVERVWERGIRKDLYKTEDDWYKSFSTVFIKRWRQATEMNLEAIRETEDQIRRIYLDTECDEIRGKVELDLDKLSHAREYYEWLNRVIALFETGEIYDIVPTKEK